MVRGIAKQAYLAAFAAAAGVATARADDAAPSDRFAAGPYCEMRCNGQAQGRWRMPNGKSVETLPVFTREFDVFPVPDAHSANETSMRAWVTANGLDLCMRTYCPVGSYRPGSYATRCKLDQGESEVPVFGTYLPAPESPVHRLRCIPSI